MSPSASPLISIARVLSEALSGIPIREPVTHVYDPLSYAWPSHVQYLQRYGRGAREVLLVGMNAGPWGMAQTGVPFGDVAMTRDWLKISAAVERPAREHPKRPVLGFACTRREVSGMRLWGWARDRFGAPEEFFQRFFVYNYCPLAFIEETGRNRTPDRLSATERAALFAPCDEALRAVVEALEPRWVIGVGRFAETRLKACMGRYDVQIARVPHPSPASPAANRGWADAAENAFRSAGVRL